MATTVNELPAGSGSKITLTPGSISFSRASTRLYCSVQNAAASSFPPVHSDCSAIRDVRRSTLINLTNSFSLSIATPRLTQIALLTHRNRNAPHSRSPRPATEIKPTRKLRLICFEVSEQLARRDPNHLGRSRFAQRRKQRLDRRLELGQSRQ